MIIDKMIIVNTIKIISQILTVTSVPISTSNHPIIKTKITPIIHILVSLLTIPPLIIVHHPSIMMVI